MISLNMSKYEIIQIYKSTKRDSNIGSQLFSDSDFSDVTLVCADNQHLPAHRAVLCANSSFLQQLLYDSQQQRTFLYLGPVPYGDLRSLLELIYLGSCSVQGDRREGVLALAVLLGVLEKGEEVCEVLEEGEEVSEVLENVEEVSEVLEKVEEVSEVLEEVSGVLEKGEEVYEVLEKIKEVNAVFDDEVKVTGVLEETERKEDNKKTGSNITKVLKEERGDKIYNLDNQLLNAANLNSLNSHSQLTDTQHGERNY